MRSIDYILDILKELTNSKTDKQMCEILGIPYGTLDRWKANDEIPAKRLMEFATKLGISMDTLLNDSVKANGNNNIAFSGNYNTISHAMQSPAVQNTNQNFAQNAELTAILQKEIFNSSLFLEFITMFAEVGNEIILKNFISQLSKIKDLSLGK